VSSQFAANVETVHQGPIEKEHQLIDGNQKKTYLTLENYMYMERQLWQNDGHEYVHEGSECMSVPS
jgi:hypothetical protein